MKGWEGVKGDKLVEERMASNGAEWHGMEWAGAEWTDRRGWKIKGGAVWMDGQGWGRAE